MCRVVIVRDAPVGGSGERVRCCRERRSGTIAAWSRVIKIVGSQAPGESAEGVEVEVNATVNSNDYGDRDDRWASRVFVPTLTMRRQASMRKGPNDVFYPQ